jgi:hypothetical protein
MSASNPRIAPVSASMKGWQNRRWSFPRDGLAERGLQRHLGREPLLHLAVEQRVTAATVVLGPVHRDDPVRAVGGLVDAFDVVTEHDELVASEACDRVRLAHRAVDALARFDEQLVAGRVPERVVDRLEPVEVDEERREHAAVAPDAGAGSIHTVGEHDAIREPGQ